MFASANHYVHANKLVHRDVKPENMLLDEHGNILLSDFGIVTSMHATTPLEIQECSGTVYYMAPEQIKGLPRPASDQYALAIVVYKWICLFLCPPVLSLNVIRDSRMGQWTCSNGY